MLQAGIWAYVVEITTVNAQLTCLKWRGNWRASLCLVVMVVAVVCCRCAVPGTFVSGVGHNGSIFAHPEEQVAPISLSICHHTWLVTRTFSGEESLSTKLTSPFLSLPFVVGIEATTCGVGCGGKSRWGWES